MRYLNSILFWSTTVTVKIVDEIGADWSNSVVDF